jgi:hypothetical protein
MSGQGGTRSWPDHLTERARRAPDLDLCVVPGSTPVVAFGDPVSAKVATVGINPSSGEFRNSAGALLAGDDRRLATLESLGLERYDQITDEHAAAIVDDCAAYFDRRPYRWFDPLDAVIKQGLGASYRDRSACHLDLVQWATWPLWGELTAEVQHELLRADVPFLKRQLRATPFAVVLVNGRSVMSALERNGIVRWRHVETIEGPPAVQVSLAAAGTTRLVAWSCNLQSQPGALTHLDSLGALVARYGGAQRKRRAPVARSTTAAPTRPARPTREAGASDGGSIPRGLHFTSKSELVAYLSVWLDQTSDDTIGGVGTYGGSVWLTVDSEAGTIRLNRDTRRAAVEAFVASARSELSYDWLVVTNRNGSINKVLFCEDRTPGWFAYLQEPLVAESRLGRGSPAATAVTPPGPSTRPPMQRAGPPSSTSDGAPPRGASDRPAPHGQVAIVQFPHPGGEHVPPGSHMGWNAGHHQRKFLLRPGRFVDGPDDQPTGGQLVFWGEWEPQSRVVARWPRRAGLPTVLHEPYWAPPGFDGTRQNTDPWVFGDCFRYSNCKQHTNNTPARKPSALQRLPAGSMILFGSAVGGGFVIDTVFVVGGKVGVFRPFDDTSHLGVDPAFDACTMQALTTYEPHIGASTYTLYRGATVDDPVHGMFSYVPCHVHGEPGMRFPRPAIDLAGLINPASKQSPSGATANDRRPLGDVIDAWHAVVHQVLAAGLHLGVQFDTPPRR